MSPYLAHVPGRGFVAHGPRSRTDWTDDAAEARVYATEHAATAAHPGALALPVPGAFARRVLTVRVDAELLAAIDSAAAAARTERATWIRTVLARAAGLGR